MSIMTGGVKMLWSISNREASAVMAKQVVVMVVGRQEMNFVKSVLGLNMSHNRNAREIARHPNLGWLIG